MSGERDLPIGPGGEPSFEGLRPTLHQPPNSEDLLRFPPATAVCARMREQMRDFADGDLARDDVLAIEEHVHGCRSCAVALGRVEHETLQIRQAFRSLAARDPIADCGPAPAGLRDAVLRRLIEETAEGVRFAPASIGGVAGVAGQASANALDGGETDGVRAAGANADIRLSPGVLLVLGSCVLALLVVLQFVLLRTDDRIPDRLARIVLTSAVDTHGMQGEHRLDLMAGAGLGDDQWIWVNKGGLAQADLHDASQQTQPAATLVLESDSALRLRNGEPVLVNGNLEIETRRPIEIAVADGSRIRLGVGQYRLSAVDEQHNGQAFDPLRGAPASLKVDVKVVSGQDAFLRPADGNPQTFSENSGMAARQPLQPGGSSGNQTGNGGGGLGSSQTGTVIEPSSESNSGVVRGMVWERSGAVPAGSDVLLSYLGGGVAHTGSTRVSTTGAFELVTGSATQPLCDSPFVVVQMVPPDTRTDLGITVPEAYRIDRRGNDRLIDPLVLDVSNVVVGRVVDADHTAVSGVRLVPCVIDELFGSVLHWPLGVQTSAVDGQFRMLRLPVSLPHHQHLVLVAEHQDFVTTVVPLPTCGSPSAASNVIEVVLPRLREIVVRGITPNANVQLWQDVVGLPAGSGARLISAQTDSNGDIPSLRAGPGLLWLRTSSARPSLRELTPEDEGGAEVYRPAVGATHTMDEIFEPLAVLPPSSLPSSSLLALPSNYRHRLLDNASLGASQVVRVVDSFAGNPVDSAQVFAVQPTGPRGRCSVRFLGFTSRFGAVPYAFAAGDGALVAISADGDVAIQGASGTNWQLDVSASGSVVLDVTLRPVASEADQCVAVSFTRIDLQLAGMRPTFQRFASPGSDWRMSMIPSGRYQVAVGDVVRVMDIASGGSFLLR